VRKTARRLLATPASAEHFARHWLDAARYADTHGIHIDNYRAIWPYRDWVINAFQQGMPWDQFTIEQIAGDLMENATLEQQIATGFNRCLATTGEGGAIAEEYEAIYAQDRVDTTAAVWLGLTTGCASCHDHKFDPITMKDNYAFTAFFRNTTMARWTATRRTTRPTSSPRCPGTASAGPPSTATSPAPKNKSPSRRKAARADFDQWLATATIEAPNEVDSTLHLHLPLVEAERPGPRHRRWPAARVAHRAAPCRGSARPRAGPQHRHPRSRRRRKLQAHRPGQLRRLHPRRGQAERRGDRPHESRQQLPRLGPLAAGRRPRRPHRRHLGHGRQQIDRPEPPHHQDLAARLRHLRRLQARPPAMAIYVDGKPVKARPSHKSVGNNIEAKVPLLLGARHGGTQSSPTARSPCRTSASTAACSPRAKSTRSPTTACCATSSALPAEKRTKQQKAALFNYYLASVDKPSRDLRARIDKLKKEQAAIKSRGSVTLVMEEKKDSEPFAHILNRGLYSDKGEQVTPPPRRPSRRCPTTPRATASASPGGSSPATTRSPHASP
jgi:hypothetical protein